MTRKLTSSDIKKLEAAGFRRWTMGRFDRLYIDATKLGLGLSYYGTGNVSAAWFDDESISNTMGRKIKSTKVWVDVADGTVHFKWVEPSSTGYEELLAERAETLMSETLEA